MIKSNGKKSNESTEIPTGAIEALARTLYPAMVTYFESEEGQREFAEWQTEQSGANLHTGGSPLKIRAGCITAQQRGSQVDCPFAV